jgi:adenylate cyclase
VKRLLLSGIPFIVFFVLMIGDIPVLQWLELKSIDWRFDWRGPIRATGDVVVVSIDEKSLHQEGRWPWPREKVASLLREIDRAGPALIGMDLIFAEPSVGDFSLAEAIREAKRVVLGYFFYQNEWELEKAEVDAERMAEGLLSILPTAFPLLSGLKEDLPTMVGVIANIPVLGNVSLSQGYFNALPDPDGVIRRFPLMVTYRDHIFPSLGLETFSHREGGFDPVPVREEDGTLRGISLGKRFIPTNKRGEMFINYRGGPESFVLYSAADFLRGKIQPDLLKGKTVLVGATAIGIYDLRVTPIAPNLPGILVQANLLDNLYRGDFIVRNLRTQLGSIGWMLVMTIILATALPRIRIVTGLFVTLNIIVLYGFLAHRFFIRGYILSLVAPTLELLTVFGAITVYRALTEERQKRRLRKAFQSYLHPDLVRELTDNLDKLKLGGEHAECTILFSDVRNFTTISEKMNPETLVELMNSYFDPIAKVIIQEGGYIDKFIGDAVMAVFGAPKKTEDHALRACRAAFAMNRTVKELEPVFRKKYGISAFHIGIGLNTGDVVVGNIGTKARLNYTVMGDTVNLASRLESATKELGSTMVLSEATYERVKDHVEARFIDEIAVKGKAERVRVYELVERRKKKR